jgi:hypothetical protein
MTWLQLTPKQAEALRDRIRPMLSFLHRCRQRMDARGFDQTSKIYLGIDKATRAVHELDVTLRSISRDSGVWRPSEDRPTPRLPTDRDQSPRSRPDI